MAAKDRERGGYPSSTPTDETENEGQVQMAQQVQAQQPQDFTGKRQAGTKDVPFDSNALLERIHGYVVHGKPYEHSDYSKEFVVVLNKSVFVEMTDPQTNIRENIPLPANKPILVAIGQLQQLVMIATQEGPVDKRHNWNAIGPNRFDQDKTLPRNEHLKDLPALEITVLSERVSTIYPAAYKGGFPTAQ